MVLQPGHAAGLVGKVAVKLGFKGRIEDGFERRSGLDTPCDQVTTKNEGGWGSVLQRELLGPR